MEDPSSSSAASSSSCTRAYAAASAIATSSTSFVGPRPVGATGASGVLVDSEGSGRLDGLVPVALATTATTTGITGFTSSSHSALEQGGQRRLDSMFARTEQGVTRMDCDRRTDRFQDREGQAAAQHIRRISTLLDSSGDDDSNQSNGSAEEADKPDEGHEKGKNRRPSSNDDCELGRTAKKARMVKSVVVGSQKLTEYLRDFSWLRVKIEDGVQFFHCSTCLHKHVRTEWGLVTQNNNGRYVTILGKSYLNGVKRSHLTTHETSAFHRKASLETEEDLAAASSLKKGVTQQIVAAKSSLVQTFKAIYHLAKNNHPLSRLKEEMIFASWMGAPSIDLSDHTSSTSESEILDHVHIVERNKLARTLADSLAFGLIIDEAKVSYQLRTNKYVSTENNVPQ